MGFVLDFSCDVSWCSSLSFSLLSASIFDVDWLVPVENRLSDEFVDNDDCEDIGRLQQQ